MDYPSLARELEILRAKAPGLPAELTRQVAAFVQTLRGEDLFKKPGVAETIDWAAALAALDTLELTPDVIRDSIGVLLKYQDDIQKIQGSAAAEMLNRVNRELAMAGNG